MIVASADLVAEASDRRLSAASVILRAGVSAREFHAAFDCLEDCMLAAFDEGLQRLTHTLTEAVPAKAAMVGKIEAGLCALLSFLDAEPGWGRILLLELPERAQTRRERTRRELSEMVSDIRFGSLLDPDPPPSRTQAARVVNEVLSVIQGHMLRDDGEALIELAAELMGSVIEPELAWRSDPGLSGDGASPPTRRCPYSGRAGRVLRALASAPRSCNRQIAKTAGLTGNSTPRVLRRLQADGLVRNVTGTTGRGQPNIWVLTVRGEEAISGREDGRDQASRAA
jgi:AcrR family transcriptional regulator